MTHILDILRGIVLQPKLVAFLRGLLEAMAFAAIAVAYEATTSNNLPDEVQPFGALIVLGLRFIEGVADSIDPAKITQRTAVDAVLPDDVARDTVAPEGAA